VSKKEKLLAEAQKLLQKGLTDKAIKIYQEALALDPQDQRVRQRLAELLIRVNRLEDARTEFLAVGKALATNGFYLKAIAVYKQIEKLFPDDITITLTLASLNEQHGLVAQAMAEYKKAFEYFERTENMAEAVTVLQSMQKTDPQNVNIRLKLAEVLHQLGRLDEAYQVFTALAGLVAERRDEASFRRLVQRVGQLFPDKGDVARVVLEQQIDEGNGEQAAQLLHSLLKSDPQQLWVWKLLLLAYDRLDNSGKLKATCQHFIKFFPAELAPREQLIRCQLLEQDAEAVVQQLEAAEKSFIAANAAPRLKELYLELEKLLPIDVRVIKGLIRAAGPVVNMRRPTSSRQRYRHWPRCLALKDSNRRSRSSQRPHRLQSRKSSLICRLRWSRRLCLSSRKQPCRSQLLRKPQSRKWPRRSRPMSFTRSRSSWTLMMMRRPPLLQLCRRSVPKTGLIRSAISSTVSIPRRARSSTELALKAATRSHTMTWAWPFARWGSLMRRSPNFGRRQTTQHGGWSA